MYQPQDDEFGDLSSSEDETVQASLILEEEYEEEKTLRREAFEKFMQLRSELLR